MSASNIHTKAVRRGGHDQQALTRGANALAPAYQPAQPARQPRRVPQQPQPQPKARPRAPHTGVQTRALAVRLQKLSFAQILGRFAIMGATFVLAALIIGRYGMISQQNYEIQRMKSSIETLHEEQNRLLTELASAQDMGMMLQKAEEMGLQNPTPDQLHVVEGVPQAPVLDGQEGADDVLDAGQDDSWWTQIMRRLFG